MIDLIKKIFGIGPAVNYSELVKQGALILDVRTKAEYKGGHIKGSINISVDELRNNLHRIPDKQKTIITCCASGMRSGSAKRLLTSTGYIAVYNGGSWASLQQKI
ncbi:MAG: rhodanese-like domain-containing protein [Cyclobacteriaceae bacterium]|nr:rhodanese-like domain-containing protein [Cyclobacteriaceae bacterium]MDH4297079.1 rhodanese-like domain-containing protein [Cyclobacteriaceae bacterium]MDH5251056.1 rhodanese-like domain-containing protein [Cyclobacteriaceae bacterium]